MKKLFKTIALGLFTVFVLCLMIPTSSFAQTPCGNIVVGANTAPIEDCNNPFDLESTNLNIELHFGDPIIENGSTQPLLNVTDSWDIWGSSAFLVTGELYLHRGNDYIQKSTFMNGAQYTFTEPGIYSVVITEHFDLQVSQGGFFDRIREFFIPTAYAFGGPTAVITFTVTGEEDPEPEPTGISNILFIPGMQASRLYSENGGNEEKLWEPGSNSDVARLAMTAEGTSIEDIYTKDVVDELLDTAPGKNIYKTFLQMLHDIGGDLGGPIVETFPYDWRRDVLDVAETGTKMQDGTMKKPTTAVEFLAGVSPTGKVTLIAHSNGGLLAKAIMRKLEEDGKADLVDKIIFIAVPHLGTPKGIAAVLHGFDQTLGHGIVADDEVVRSVIQNMPGAYGLLPSEQYFSTEGTPMITFDDSSMTKQFRDRYGFAISNLTEYRDFLVGAEGRADAGLKVNEVMKGNGSIVDKEFASHQVLDSWTPPAGVEVYEIVGTGLVTPKSVEYREYMEAPCPSGQCVIKGKLEPVLHFTRYGDKTVVTRSASAVATDNKYYFNLLLANRGLQNPDNDHADIVEAPEIQQTVESILHGSSTEGISFVTNSEPTFNDNFDIETIHSPARIHIRDSNGNITGRTTVGGEWKTEIPNSDYFEAGGVKYVLVPSDISYNVVIEGEGSGIFTHGLATLKNDTETASSSFTATVTPTTVATYQKSSSGTFTNVSIDTNGDGKVDTVLTQGGTIIEEEATYDDLALAIRVLSIPKVQKHILLELISQAEKLSKQKGKKLSRVAEKALLIVIQQSIDKFKKAGIVTKVESQNINRIISQLIK